MELVQSRIVTDDVEGLAGFYARLLGVPVALNEYYVEIDAGLASVGFSKRRFTEYRENDGAPAASRRTSRRSRRGNVPAPPCAALSASASISRFPARRAWRSE